VRQAREKEAAIEGFHEKDRFRLQYDNDNSLTMKESSSGHGINKCCEDKNDGNESPVLTENKCFVDCCSKQRDISTASSTYEPKCEEGCTALCEENPCPQRDNSVSTKLIHQKTNPPNPLPQNEHDLQNAVMESLSIYRSKKERDNQVLQKSNDDLLNFIGSETVSNESPIKGSCETMNHEPSIVWSRDMDEYLRKLAHEYLFDFQKISQHLLTNQEFHRKITADECRKRWSILDSEIDGKEKLVEINTSVNPAVYVDANKDRLSFNELKNKTSNLVVKPIPPQLGDHQDDGVTVANRDEIMSSLESEKH